MFDRTPIATVYDSTTGTISKYSRDDLGIIHGHIEGPNLIASTKNQYSTPVYLSIGEKIVAFIISAVIAIPVIFFFVILPIMLCIAFMGH